MTERTIVPVRHTCLIKLDPVQDRVGSILVADSYKTRHQAAQTVATLMAAGGNAFEDFKGDVPKPGDRVLVHKYAGEPPKAGDFEDLHRLCTDENIIAIVR